MINFGPKCLKKATWLHHFFNVAKATNAFGLILCDPLKGAPKDKRFQYFGLIRTTLLKAKRNYEETAEFLLKCPASLWFNLWVIVYNPYNATNIYRKAQVVRNFTVYTPTLQDTAVREAMQTPLLYNVLQ